MSRLNLFLAVGALAVGFALARNASGQTLAPGMRSPMKNASQNQAAGKNESSFKTQNSKTSVQKVPAKDAATVTDGQVSVKTHPSKPQVFEAMCRVKAKDAANQAFNNCMGESKVGEIEKVRQEYQDKLSKMKAEYEAELNKISGKKKNAAQNPLMNNEILNEPALEEGTSETAPVENSEVSSETQTGESLRTEEPVEREAPRSKKSKSKANLVFSDQSKAAKSRAVLFTELTDVPEPVPMDVEHSH